MKKIWAILIILFLLINSSSLLVFAVADSVSLSQVDYKSGSLTYSGQVADGVLAVAILLYDPDEKLILMDSVGVDSSNNFSGSRDVSLKSSGTYRVKASKYEGGTFSEKTFDYTLPASPPPPAEEEEEEVEEVEDIDLADEETSPDLPEEDKKPEDKDKDKPPTTQPDSGPGEGPEIGPGGAVDFEESDDLLEPDDLADLDQVEDRDEEDIKIEEDKLLDQKKEEEARKRANRIKTVGQAVGVATGATMVGGLGYWFLKIRKP